MLWRRRAGVIGIAILLAACGGSTAQRDPRAAAPTIAEAGSERPALDLWDNFGIPEGHEAGRYESLPHMVRWAHVVVRGTVTGVDGGTLFPEDEPDIRGVRLHVRVDEVQKGDVRVGATLPVGAGLAELEMDVEEVFAPLVDDVGIFFLVPAGSPRPEFGITGIEPSDHVRGDWMLVNSQGVAVDDRRTAVWASNEVRHGFPASLEGMPFAELEDRVRELAAR